VQHAPTIEGVPPRVNGRSFGGMTVCCYFARLAASREAGALIGLRLFCL